MDIREFRFPEQGRNDKPKKVDFDKAAEVLGCNKIELTKNMRPEFIDWARKQK